MIKIPCTNIKTLEANKVFAGLDHLGEERWHMLRERGFTAGEVAKVMADNGLLGGKVDSLSENRRSPARTVWTQLFFAGYSLEDLKRLGFRGAVSPEKTKRLEKLRSNGQLWHRPSPNA